MIVKTLKTVSIFFALLLPDGKLQSGNMVGQAKNAKSGS